MTEKNITLDVLLGESAETVHAVRGDTESRTLIFSLCAGGKVLPLTPEDTTVLLRASVGSATPVGVCGIDGGRAVYTLASAFTAEIGLFDCELAVYKGSGDNMKILYCPKFRLRVEPSLENDGELEVDDRYSGLSVLINRAEAAAEAAEAAAESKADKAVPAAAGHLAALDADGNLTDSGKSVSDLAVSGHTHAISQIPLLKDKLDLKASSSELSAHTGNAAVHVTSDERTAWNQKLDRFNTAGTENMLPIIKYDGTLISSGKKIAELAPVSELSNHAGDGEIHVSEDDRVKWDGKPDPKTVETLPVYQTLAHNTEYRLMYLGWLTALNLTLPDPVPEIFEGCLYFVTGANPASINASGIVFKGDSCSGGSFSPEPSSRYEIVYKNCGSAVAPYVVARVSLI